MPGFCHFGWGLWLVGLLLVFSASAQTEIRNIWLTEGWEFRRVGDTTWLPASVPGCVYTDLMAAGLIPDPFLDDHEKDVQWIENEDWEYRKQFRLPDNVKGISPLELVFGGLDTDAEVFLNGHLILETNNMFRRWSARVDGLLNEDTNTIRVLFKSTVQLAKEAYRQLPVPLPDDFRVMSRKAPFQFGWDWGARLVGPGLWKSVSLGVPMSLMVKHCRVVTRKASPSLAELEFKIEIESETSGLVMLEIFNQARKPERLFHQEVQLTTGINRFSIPVVMRRPRLWNCNGLGVPELYTFSVDISSEGTRLSREWQAGIRTLRLVQEGPEGEKSFVFELNGRKVFAKGANYVPADQFPHRIKYNDYEEILTLARDAGLNMIRVWGGGVYPDNSFYEIADRLGIMIWQDFMFACAMYPGDRLFLANVEAEAREQVRRIGGHPSLALWCGNNEVSEGWHNWGWQKTHSYSALDSARIWNDYLRLFEGLLPRIVEEEDGQTHYIPSSPKHGWGRPQSLIDGDMHYWGVWWGDQPFGMYQQKVGRFMSEYGFQASPDISSFSRFLTSENLSIQNPQLRNHQKHPRGFELIDSQMKRYFPTPVDFPQWVYLSQLTQAYGMETAISAHLSARPHCMGTLFWQWNDSWPVISWSAIDYYRTPKAFYYRLKDWFSPQTLLFVEKDGSPQITLVNDLIGADKGELTMKQLDFSGRILRSRSEKLQVGSGEVRVTRLGGECWDSTARGRSFLQVTWIGKGGRRIERLFFPGWPGNLELKDPGLRVVGLRPLDPDINGGKVGYSVSIACNTLAKDVMLYLTGFDYKLNDNWFDVLPETRKDVIIETRSKIQPEDIRWMSFFDVLRNSPRSTE